VRRPVVAARRPCSVCLGRRPETGEGGASGCGGHDEAVRGCTPPRATALLWLRPAVHRVPSPLGGGGSPRLSVVCVFVRLGLPD